MAKNGMVNLLTILDQLPGGVTLSDVRAVAKGKINFAPEQVDDIIAEIKSHQEQRTGNPVHFNRPEPIAGTSVIPDEVREEVLAGRPLGQLTLKPAMTAS